MLTGKQQQFVNEYLCCFNATEAARRAGYSEKTASEIGYENLRKPQIAEAIKRRLAETAMSADEVVMRLAEHARSDIGHFLHQDENGEIRVALLDEAGALLPETRLIKKVTQRKLVRTSKDMLEEETTLALELYDAQAALVHLGKHHKLFVDRTEHTGKDGEPLAAPPVVIYIPDNGRGDSNQAPARATDAVSQ